MKSKLQESKHCFLCSEGVNVSLAPEQISQEEGYYIWLCPHCKHMYDSSDEIQKSIHRISDRRRRFIEWKQKKEAMQR